MLKYVDTKVTFSEVPDQITLCINISNCPCHCKGCHSAYLAEDIGDKLTPRVLSKLIEDNNGITCVAFMGGDIEPMYISFLAEYVKVEHPNIKVAWYSGKSEIHEEVNLWNVDYIKIGSYLEECGPLNCKTTNQRFYGVAHLDGGISKIYDITYKFFKKDETENKDKKNK